VSVADRILDETSPGSVTAVVGRPGAGVSTVLVQICGTAAGATRVVLASWERPPAWSDSADEVARPEIVAWSAAELGRCREVRAAGAGTVVAVDYLQLLSDPDDGAAGVLRSLATTRGWRLVLGVMAPRALKDLDTAMPPALAVRRAGHVLSSALQHADRAVVLTGREAGMRTASLGVPTATTDSVGWRVGWTISVDDR
jgi:hypothetical protein